MLRDYKLSRRNSGKHPNVEDIENIPVNHNRIEEQEVVNKSSKVEKTPVKPTRSRYSDAGTPLKTPDKRGGTTGNRFGWAQKNESSSSASEIGVDLNYNRNTPRSTKAVMRGNSSNSESNSTQCTPTKSVTKPPNQGTCLTTGHRPPMANGGARMANFAALSKGISSYGSSTTYVNTVEVPHFEMKEDPSFWMDHNIQVLIRVRPLNNMEKSTQGYNRCLKQESSQCITWIGHPETRFTFDHVACESVEQETLFRMVGLPMVENCLSGYNSCMFAYGQTGSGKTYTMLGDIDELGVKPSPNRGMTPRIFEFLFARIRAEEESRRDERLAYNCKCSFLEIYNEQITDLLDPSSTNLLLREDTKTGVYVENLSEFEVETVADILKLLSQGSANRKVAATNMNRESSRSHSVFTCVIESRWEKDSTSNLRFARLNLVDLAGSERQKSSGAEGERLKEAANINKSLSTLGHVIMVLVDLAHAKTRHVPYRDSRLTFLLQDSLGGNSKTMIIANVSPSICSAAETLNTLKFAQRAKLIQNNAVVNEDSSGDVTALQHQIRILKEEVLALKRQNVSRSLSFGSTIVGGATQKNGSVDGLHSTEEMLGSESKSSLSISSKQLKCLETTLSGALRREKMAEGTIKQLEAEIEQLNRLVRQREEDTRCTKMMLKFREEKIQRMEILLGGLMPADTYLVEENKALFEEIQQLRAKVDKNPEVTRFALENIRLLEQLRRYQDFYEEGERDMLLTEVSESRDQLLLFLDGDLKQHNSPNKYSPSKEAECISAENDSLHLELKKTLNELEECRSNLNSCLENNAKLSREIDDLQASLNHLKSETHDNNNIDVTKESVLELPFDEQESDSVQQKNEEMLEALMKQAQEVMDLQLELDILKIILKEERSSRGDLEEKELCLIKDLEMADRKASLLTKQYENAKEELREAKSVIDALENQQLLSISEMEDLRNSNTRNMKLMHKLEHEISTLKQQGLRKEIKDVASFKLSKTKDSPLQLKLKKMHDSLDNAKRLNMCYQSDLASHASNEEEMDEVRRQVEAETAEVIVCLQEELGNLQQQFLDSTLKEEEAEGKLMHLHTELKKLQEDNEALTHDNINLCEKLSDKDEQLKNLSAEWETVISEIETALAGGCEALKDASDQLDGISGSLPQRRTWISEQVGKMTKSISEKELLIEELNCCLEDANNRKNDSTLKEEEAEGKLMHLHTELKKLQEDNEALTHDNINLCEKLSDKDEQLKNLSAEWETVISEIETALAGGCEALKDASDQLDGISGSLPQRRTWISEQVGKMTKSISEKELLIEELNCCLEDANNRKNDSTLKEEEAEGKSELKKLQEDNEALTHDNINLCEKLSDKDEQLKNLSAEWETVISEIETALAGGCEALKDAFDQLDGISGSLPQKRTWISEQVGKMTKSISEKELLIEELNCCLEDANNRKNDLEVMMRSLRGAALVITEEHQKDCTEKEKEIMLLTSEMSDMRLTIEDLENKMKYGEEELRKVSKCATVAFLIVSRLSEKNSGYLHVLEHKDIQLTESNGIHMQKDALLLSQAVKVDEAEKMISSLSVELKFAKEDCGILREQLNEEKKRVIDLEQQLDENEGNYILETREKLSELKHGISTLDSCLTIAEVANPQKDSAVEDPGRLPSDDKSEERTGTGENQEINNLQKYAVPVTETDTLECLSEVGRNLHKYSSEQKSLAGGAGRDATVALLREEIESAVESVKRVHFKMANLRKENKAVCDSEKRTRQVMEIIISQVLSLQERISNFENQAGSKMNCLDHKLLKIENAVKDTLTSWYQNNEFFEHEVSDSKLLAIQKSAEASCILAKFEEAQHTISEADFMLNQLMLANESKKVEIKGLKKEKLVLISERDCLINEVRRLESSNNQKDFLYENLEKQAESDFTAMKELVQELEGIVSQAQFTCNEHFESISSDFLCLKSQVCNSNMMVQSWIEEIWSETILKDCAVSVLHLCHMGILLETVTGLNVENGLLHHGLHESDSLIYELREHNFKSKRDLEMCRVLEGKLLADIKNNFDRISRKEDETGQLSFKLTSFEKKILDLQQQEEIMLQRSNYMGSELTVLMKELDNSNRNVLATLLDREKLLKDKDDSLEDQEEQFFIDLSERDFHLLVLVAEMKQLAFQKAKLEDEHKCYATGLDRLKKDLVLLLLDSELKELMLLDNEVELTCLGSELELVRMEQNDMLSKISLQSFEISELKEANNACEKEIKLIKEVSCSNDFLTNELVEMTAEKKKLSCQFQIQVAEVDYLKEEIIFLKNEHILHEENNSEALRQLSSKFENFVNEMQKYAEGASEFLEEIESVEILSEEVISRNCYLEAELERKDSVLEGLLFDHKLLQESASSNKDQKDEFVNLLASYEDLENEHDEAVEKVQILEAQLQEKTDFISTLELDVSRAHGNVDSLSSINLKLTKSIANALQEKEFIEKELVQRCKDNQNLESELLEMRTALEQMNEFIESLKINLHSVVCERDATHAELLTLKEEFQMAQNLADENGAIAIEAQQVAETRKLYLDEKEEEVRLLERSVEELERTVNVLESKVDILKGETELQLMERQDLEMKLQSIKQKMQIVESGNDEMKRGLDDKEKRLQEVLQRMQILEREIVAKDTEISKCKTHISELNLHAEAQACEYKQKFKALEVMAEQVKSEGLSSTNSISSAPHSTNSSSNKLEKSGSRPRGSGSPFKCIGLGFVQQMKSERDDDELTAGRLRIEELEALATSRQKEIFMLNTRLATAESMTHDVLRDLLGLKSDMTGYASLIDNQQVQKITEKAQLHNTEVHKDLEVCNLKKQLTEFVVERKGWLEEIDRKQAELVATQIALEELRQHDRLLTTKNEMLMTENVNQKKKVVELELEVKKLSGQQNIQQRIHHHAKIKEENNVLKAQNEELSSKLRRSEGILSRVQEELARYRAANGKNPCIHIEEEHRLNSKLKEIEEERLQLAQKLLGLCTSILKAAGITRPASDISLPAAEEALEQLKDRPNILNRELQELKLKSRITNERNRLSELMPQLQRSPPSRSEGSRQSTANRASQSPFLSCLDR